MTWKRTALVAVVVGLAGVAAGALWITRQEAHRLVTNPIATRRMPSRNPQDLSIPYDELAIVRPDRARLVAWHIPSTNGALVIAQHGYRADRSEMLEEADMLHRRGYGVLMPAMRAHDASDDEQLTFGKRELDDLEAWIALAATLPGVERGRIGILGNSLGGTLGIGVAARQPAIAAVAANSAFSSLRDTIDTSVRFFTGLPPFPFAPMIRFWAERAADISIDEVDAKRWIGSISPRPVLLMQGGADVVIDRASGQRLYEAAGEPRTLWFDPAVGHSRFDTARPDEYAQRVGGFFDSSLLRP